MLVDILWIIGISIVVGIICLFVGYVIGRLNMKLTPHMNDIYDEAFKEAYMEMQEEKQGKEE